MEPANSGFQGEWLIHYAMAAPISFQVVIFFYFNDTMYKINQQISDINTFVTLSTSMFMSLCTWISAK